MPWKPTRQGRPFFRSSTIGVGGESSAGGHSTHPGGNGQAKPRGNDMGAGASYVLCLRPFRGSGSPEKIDVPDRCPKRLATWRVSVVPTGGQSSWPRVRSPWDGKPSRPHVDYTALRPSGLPPRDEKTGARPDLSRFPPRLVPWPRRNASAGDPTPRFEAPEPRDPTSSPRRSAPMGAPSERGGE